MSNKTAHRFVVSDQFKDGHKLQLMLDLSTINKSENLVSDNYKCLLTGVWFTTDVKCGQIIHLIDADFDEQLKQFAVNNEKGMVVVSPDVLVPSTTLMSANYCMRKAWLNSKFAVYVSVTNKSMVVGNIVHQLFQSACQRRLKGVNQLNEALKECIEKMDILNVCYTLGVSKDEIISDAQQYIPHIALWLQNYLFGMCSLNDPYSAPNSDDVKLQVMRVHDIEENLWNTRLGLKGKSDLSVEVVIHQKQLKRRQVVPLEIKTGKSSFSSEHEGQVSLYSMMMEDKTHSNEGILLYLKDGPQMRHIITKKEVKRDLIHLRNTFVNHLENIESGPKPLNCYRICSKCDHLFDCSLTLQTLEPQNLSQSDVMSNELVPQFTNHLSTTELDFFKEWMSLLHLEISFINEQDSHLKLGFWNEPSIEREANGLGLAKLVYVRRCDDSYMFVRSPKFMETLGQFSVNNDSVIRQWERVCLSIDSSQTLDSVKSGSYISNYCKQIAISVGFVKSIDSDEVELILDNMVRPLNRNSIFRIDHISSANLQSTNFSNLLLLMSNTNEQSIKLRQIIIDRKTISHSNKFKSQILTKGKHILKAMNEHQQRAVLKALSTDSYLLVRGTPGSGKTQTIVALVRLLVQLNLSVLITSFTHTAVDNILLKLKNFGVDFVRIGSEKRIHKDLLSYSISNKTSNIETVEELKTFYTNISVVASTCLGVTTHSIFNSRTFDFCIIDEASQILLPTCLGPLFLAKRFILVGDAQQLPPVVRSTTAKMLGLDQSLFMILQNDSNTVDLTVQYRMNKEIMRIANDLTYNGVLRCADNLIANSTIACNFDLLNVKNDWISQLLSSDLSKSVIFLDTDKIPAEQTRDKTGKISNQTESQMVKIIVESFLKRLNIKAIEIGIISPFQKQVRLIKQMICAINIEVNTVDQYQGRDKDIIIYSCVRSKVHVNGMECDFAKTDLLNDERRLNVAITRAKRKLIIIGSKSTLSNLQPFYRLFTILRSEQILSITKEDILIIE